MYSAQVSQACLLLSLMHVAHQQIKNQKQRELVVNPPVANTEPLASVLSSDNYQGSI
jgi:hypothetical protein